MAHQTKLAAGDAMPDKLTDVEAVGFGFHESGQADD